MLSNAKHYTKLHIEHLAIWRNVGLHKTWVMQCKLSHRTDFEILFYLITKLEYLQ